MDVFMVISTVHYFCISYKHIFYRNLARNAITNELRNIANSIVNLSSITTM